MYLPLMAVLQLMELSNQAVVQQNIPLSAKKTIVIDGNSTTVQANWSSSWNTSSFGSLGNDGTLIIVDNPNTTQRAAIITLTQEGSGKQVTITVRQKKKNSVDIED